MNIAEKAAKIRAEHVADIEERINTCKEKAEKASAEGNEKRAARYIESANDMRGALDWMIENITSDKWWVKWYAGEIDCGFKYNKITCWTSIVVRFKKNPAMPTSFPAPNYMNGIR